MYIDNKKIEEVSKLPLSQQVPYIIAFSMNAVISALTKGDKDKIKQLKKEFENIR